MGSKKILVVSHEMSPYTDLTSLSDVVRDLAVNLQKDGGEIRVFMPKFGMIKERKHRLHEVIRLSGLNITIGRENNPLIIKVASLQTAKIQVYFLDNSDFFQRKYYFADDKGKSLPDNDNRMIFFNKGVLELLFKLGWIPDLIHCHGWFSSLVPFYARTAFKNEPALKHSHIVYGYHHTDYEEQFKTGFVKKGHLTGGGNYPFLDKPKISQLTKLGIDHADSVIVTSEHVPNEIMSNIKESKKTFLDGSKIEGDELFLKYQETITV